MRVKTVPRHRIIQDRRDTDPASEAVESFRDSTGALPYNGENESSNVSRATSNCTSESLNSNGLEDSVEKEKEEEKEKDDARYCQEVLDMSMKHKKEKATSEKDSSNRCSIAGPSNCEKLSSSLTEEKNSNSNNNNITISNANLTNSCPVTTCSCMERLKSCDDKRNASSSDEDQSSEAVNLCKKDCQEEDTSNAAAINDEKLKDTFLYKIMTDPTFLENIQKHKQPRKHVCQFCKQDFLNSDELAEHMDGKKDESNQVVCCACKKTFAQKRYLRYHQRCHSERAKFTCDYCTKKYTRLDNLTRHNAFHVNPDKFRCTYCEKTFARKDLLNKHLKYHDNKYRFFCELCHKYFKGLVMLDNHKKTFHAVT